LALDVAVLLASAGTVEADVELLKEALAVSWL